MLMIKSRIQEKAGRVSVKYTVLFICSVVLFVLTFGCATRQPISRETSAPGELANQYSIHMELVPLSEEELIIRFGKKTNPFIAPQSLMGINDFHAYQVTVQNSTEPDSLDDASIIIELKNIRLLYGGRAIAPLNRFKLTDMWENEGRHAHGREYDISKMKYVIRRQVFPNTLQVPAGQTYSGILVFMGRIPSYGEGKVHIPVITADKELIGIFYEELTF